MWQIYVLFTFFLLNVFTIYSSCYKLTYIDLFIFKIVLFCLWLLFAAIEFLVVHQVYWYFFFECGRHCIFVNRIPPVRHARGSFSAVKYPCVSLMCQVLFIPVFPIFLSCTPFVYISRFIWNFMSFVCFLVYYCNRRFTEKRLLCFVYICIYKYWIIYFLVET